MTFDWIIQQKKDSVVKHNQYAVFTDFIVFSVTAFINECWNGSDYTKTGRFFTIVISFTNIT